MEYKRVSAMAVAALFALTSCAWVISAEEDEGAPVIITAPADGAETISCAVFFADNMVYTPQWRLDNYVRIEVMVLNMDGLADPSELLVSATDLYPSIYTDGLAQQAAIIANSAEVLPLTKMVSVSYISVTITSDMLDEPIVLEAGWDTVTLAKVIDNGFGREVNKAGHLIYGTLWDTTGLSEGDYTTEIRLGVAKQDALGNWYGDVGEWYDVNYAIGHLYNPEVEGEYLVPDHPYDDLAVDGEEAYELYKIGEGGLTADDAAWILLGPLIPQGAGGGSGNGGEGGGDGGNGGDGNGHGGENGGGGNGHGGKLNQAHSYVK
jgi:uncharacterized membrane protein YgcG